MEEDLLVSMENAQISWAVSVVHALMISWVLHVKTEVHNYCYDKCYISLVIHSWYHRHIQPIILESPGFFYHFWLDIRQKRKNMLSLR